MIPYNTRLFLLIPSLISLSLFTSVSAQSPLSVGAQTTNASSSLPVLLIHGYSEDASVWKKWETLLKNDSIRFEAVNFTNYNETTNVNEDKCGSAKDHAMELNDIVEGFKDKTSAERINIVARSKGGLDSRVYLANNLSNTNIANLIMIGTPNNGSSLAYINNLCFPAIFDLRSGSNATNAIINNNTKYYTIGGNWTPSLEVVDLNCSPDNPFFLDFQRGGYLVMFANRPNDGIVPLLSVQSLKGSIHLGTTNNCHSDLLGDEEYKLARELLLGRTIGPR